MKRDCLNLGETVLQKNPISTWYNYRGPKFKGQIPKVTRQLKNLYFLNRYKIHNQAIYIQ